ncbi:MAG: hypothetical protein COC19_00375 [SAR86 cluster bacterium]|uniref:Lnb N-terminal periplasmic domain-containing protein n=1 Tax=SAR86 cluster bacterium TaxID=2030880 RepID=A0A2A4MVV0_9GAMM|nr:MAG: hypothetical protein COC19_00375 [SAR86 cluster bacterium]
MIFIKLTILLFYKRILLLRFLMSATVLLFASTPSLASAAAYPPLEELSTYQMPTDMSRLHFYLITVDVGNQVYDNFGHTALRVVDENTGSDTVFNWGLFDVSSGVVSFSFDFFKGVMNYQLGLSSPQTEIAMYAQQRRTVWQDKINLNNTQKERLYRRLMWNAQSENRVYSYQYFFDNCTTRVRDYLNEALSGKIAEFNTGVTAYSFRDQIQSHYSSVGIVAFSLDVLLNSNIDRKISAWEEMFLPLSLRQRLMAIPSDVAVAGDLQMLLSESQILLEYQPPQKQLNAYAVVAVVLLAPILFLFAMLKKMPISYFTSHSRYGLRMPGFSFRLLAVLAVITSVFSGVYGILMLGSWFASDHLDLHHNLNLLLFWPTDLLGLIVACRWFFAIKPWPLSHSATPFVYYYLIAHLAGMLIYFVIAVLGLSQQWLDGIAYFVVPSFFLYTLLLTLVGFGAIKPRNTLL